MNRHWWMKRQIIGHDTIQSRIQVSNAGRKLELTSTQRYLWILSLTNVQFMMANSRSLIVMATTQIQPRQLTRQQRDDWTDQKDQCQHPRHSIAILEKKNKKKQKNNVYVLDWEDQLAANQQMNQHLSHSYLTKSIESIAWRHDQCTK